MQTFTRKCCKLLLLVLVLGLAVLVSVVFLHQPLSSPADDVSALHAAHFPFQPPVAQRIGRDNGLLRLDDGQGLVSNQRQKQTQQQQSQQQQEQQQQSQQQPAQQQPDNLPLNQKPSHTPEPQRRQETQPEQARQPRPAGRDVSWPRTPYIPSQWAYPGLHRIVLATVPRSGNGWIRGMLETATGIATESVFPEKNSVWRNRTRAYANLCGWETKECGQLRPSNDTDPVIVKTHFPFTAPRGVNGTALLKRNMSDAGPCTYQIIAVRNPIDNYEAWIRYIKKTGKRYNIVHGEFRDFVRAWVEHHSFWFDQGVPSFVYRYEDLIDRPFEVLRKALQMSGLWSYLDMSEHDIQRVAAVPKLQPYDRKKIGSKAGSDDVMSNYQKYSLDDIRWVLHTYKDVLRRYGYDELYAAWILAKTGAWDEERLLQRVKDIMRRTSQFAVWGERYDGYRDLVRKRIQFPPTR